MFSNNIKGMLLNGAKLKDIILCLPKQHPSIKDIFKAALE